MSSSIKEYIHKPTGERHEIFAIDDYFGAHIYGYKTPDGRVLTHEEFKVEYQDVSKGGL